MKNKGVWVLLIALGVFVGLFSFRILENYSARLEIQKLEEALSAEQAEMQRKFDAQRQQRAAEQQQERAKRDYKNTACAVNENTNNCVCIDERTGAKIVLPQADCKKRAREITW